MPATSSGRTMGRISSTWPTRAWGRRPRTSGCCWPATGARQLRSMLEGYEQFHAFNREELGLIEPLRTLRLVHYSAWLARRWGDPAFPAAFPWFNTQRYWQDRVLELKEQIALMQEEPIRV